MITPEVKSKKTSLINYLKSLWLDISAIKNEELMFVAFIHKSYAADFKDKISHNERLEFLWDSVLGLIIAKLLFQDYENFEESTLTLYKISLVREETLAAVALNIWLNNQIFLWRGEEKSWWRDKKVIIADCLEALIGYIYIDLWITRVEYFVSKYIYPMLGKIKDINMVSNKTMLQEYVQKEFKELPKYLDFDFEKDKKWNVIKYKTQVFVLWELKWEWYWVNKKAAQDAAAKDAYTKYKWI